MSEPTKTQAPFAQSTQQVKNFVEHPYVKAAGWLFSKGAWLLLIWAVWSLKQYGHEYIAEAPAVEAHGKSISMLGERVNAADKAAEKQSLQIAQMQANQIEINRLLEKNNQALQQTNSIISGLQTAQAVLDVRIQNLDRSTRRGNDRD